MVNVLAAQHPRHIVCVQPGGVDDRAGENGFALGAEHDAVRVGIGADQLRAWQEDDAGVFAGAQQRLDERLGVHDAGLGRKDCRLGAECSAPASR